MYEWGNASSEGPKIIQSLLPSRLGCRIVQISAGGFGFSGALAGILSIVKLRLRVIIR